ncbi:MAG TPA: DUF4265 domain-containing protein [Chloroflexia bacterium]|nr:DUF4265 domain-containing protein [Chloroflexia bacterium]
MEQAVKIRFTFEGEPDVITSGEQVWAESLGNNLYRLLNIPIRAIGYAEKDVVRCEERHGMPQVRELVEDSGNGTIRLYFTDLDSSEAAWLIKELVAIGCSYERYSAEGLAVTVPANLKVSFERLANFLNQASAVNTWEVAKRPGATIVEK